MEGHNHDDDDDGGDESQDYDTTSPEEDVLRTASRWKRLKLEDGNGLPSKLDPYGPVRSNAIPLLSNVSLLHQHHSLKRARSFMSTEATAGTMGSSAMMDDNRSTFSLHSTAAYSHSGNEGFQHEFLYPQAISHGQMSFQDWNESRPHFKMMKRSSSPPNNNNSTALQSNTWIHDSNANNTSQISLPPSSLSTLPINQYLGQLRQERELRQKIPKEEYTFTNTSLGTYTNSTSASSSTWPQQHSMTQESSQDSATNVSSSFEKYGKQRREHRASLPSQSNLY